MALFGKKSKDSPAPPSPGAPANGASPAGEKKRGFGRGRKQDNAPAAGAAGAGAGAPGAAPDTTTNPDDFFDFSEDALAAASNGHGANGSVAPADSDRGKKKTAKAKGLKSGTVVGLNIGTDSIKAIELRVKGTEIAITGMGMLPTPEDSIANGVVMSVASLSHAIRDVLQQAGIKSKRVVTSVAGTGALVVRVIEVPKMSDNELEDNMKVDADRYIPFPPSEVIMDFKALRDLPTDPDAPNMEVLLAAAQREIIDLHVQVLEGAKLDPRSIDVEPLSAVRALTAREINPNAAGADTIDGTDYVDYNDVSAVVNIGAASTEISIVRGDVLVFTRNVPTGGQTMTQAIVDYFGLHWPDAEHAKRQWGDALPHPVDTPAPADYGTGDATQDYFGAPAGGADAMDDWSEFGLDDTTVDTTGTGFDAPAATPTGAPAPAAPPAPTGAPAGSAFDADPFGVAATTSGAAPAAGGAASQSVDPFDLDFDTGTSSTGGTAAPAADPFDLDFFSQGPQDTQNNEPGEQHGQKEDDTPGSASSGDTAKDDDGKGAPVFDFSDFSFDDEEPASAAGTTGAGEEDKLPTLQDSVAGVSDIEAVDEEDAVLPTTTSPPGQTTVVPSAFDFPSGGSFSAFDDDEDESTLPTIVSESAASTPSVSVAGLESTEEDEDQVTSLPTMVGAAPGTPAAVVPTPVTESAPASSTSRFSLEKSDIDVAPEVPAASAEPEPEAENFDFDLTPLATPAAAATDVPHTPLVLDKVPAQEEDDFDIDSLFGDTPGATAAAPAAPDLTGVGVGDGATGLDDGILAAHAAPAPAADFGGFDDTLDSFGAGLTDTGLSMGIDEQALYGVLSPILDGLAAEVRRSLEYHATRYPDAAVQHITLIGGGAKLKNIDAYFAQNMGIPTTVGNPLASLTVQAPKLPPDYATEMGPLFVVALGLALRDLVR